MECHCRLNACLSSEQREGENETEGKKRRRGEDRRGKSRKVQDPDVFDDVRMSKKENTVVLRRKHRRRGVKMGGWIVG